MSQESGSQHLSSSNLETIAATQSTIYIKIIIEFENQQWFYLNNAQDAGLLQGKARTIAMQSLLVQTSIHESLMAIGQATRRVSSNFPPAVHILQG